MNARIWVASLGDGFELRKNFGEAFWRLRAALEGRIWTAFATNGLAKPLGMALEFRAKEGTESEIDHLEILRAGDGREGVGTGSDVEDEGLLEPGD